METHALSYALELRTARLKQKDFSGVAVYCDSVTLCIVRITGRSREIKERRSDSGVTS